MQSAMVIARGQIEEALDPFDVFPSLLKQYQRENPERDLRLIIRELETAKAALIRAQQLANQLPD